MQKKSAALKIGLGAAAAFELALAGMTPAFALDVQIGPEQVAPYEVGGVGTEDGFNYDQWHIGSNANPALALDGSVTFNECSVTTLAHENTGSWVQVLKGFPVAARPTAEVGGADLSAISALLNSVSITVVEDLATIQIPVFYGDLNEPLFTTVRSEPLAAGTHSLAGLALETSAFGPELPSGFILADLLADWEAELADPDSADGYGFQILGVGFNGNEGAAVGSLSFGGDTYYFGNGDCLPVVDTPPTEDAPTPTLVDGQVAPTPPAKIDTAA